MSSGLAAMPLEAPDAAPLPAVYERVPRRIWRGRCENTAPRAVPEETAVALTYNGSTQAVMMATPADLEDFAVGFSLTERLISDVSDIESLEVIPLEDGVEARLWISESCNKRLTERRRMTVGPTGCGLCGVDSLAEVLPPPNRVESDARFEPEDVLSAIHALSCAQSLHRKTRAVHAAGFWTPEAGLVAAREDLGRHNAMDKLVGALMRSQVERSGGIAVITSRVSVEIVQKTTTLGAPVLAAVSAPTALAVRTAERAGLTLVAVARGDGFEIFTRPERIGG